MDLLSETDIFPSRVTAIIRFLLTQRGQAARESVLREAMSPPSLREQTRMIDNNLKACGDMGLTEVTQEQDPLVALTSPARETFRKNVFDANGARLLIARAVCRPDDGGSRAFCEALAWFLAHDPLRHDTEREAVRAQLGRAGSADYLSLRNDTRYEAVAYWSVYAGFAWSCVRPDGVKVPIFDPTAHLALVLPAYCTGQDHNGRPIRDLCDDLARDWPVYSGGHYWKSVRSLLGREAQDPERLAPALHLAFRRLEQRGWLRLIGLSDAPRLATAGGHLTHVRWLRKKGGR